MAVIQDAEFEAGFQVMVRWYVSASQRYPADENEYYTSFYQVLEPNQLFELMSEDFDLNLVNDPNEELEYIIRDVCYVQTLTPQFVGFHYYFPGYRRRAALTVAATIGQVQITVDDTTLFTQGNTYQLGPEQGDDYVLASIDSSTTLTFTTPLERNFEIGTDVNEQVTSLGTPYPDNNAASGIARVLDNEGLPVTDPLEVTTPLYYDTGETVLRYYYSDSLEQPFNGARGFGETVDRAPLTHNGQEVVGRWWSLADEDETAATRACLIDNQGFVIDCREADHAFDLQLSYSEFGETDACVTLETETYYADHPNFRTQTSPTPAGTTSILNPDSTNPPLGFYAWTSTIAGDASQRFVRHWDGMAFSTGVVSSGTVDNCPVAISTSVEATLYSTEQAMACRVGGTSVTLYYAPITGTGFTSNNVSGIWTDPFGPSSSTPSELSTTFLVANGNQFLWNGTSLVANTTDCTGSAYCGDVTALNYREPEERQTGDFRNDAVCQFPMQVCTDPDANNYVAPNPPAIISGGTCNYNQYTAQFVTTANITNQNGDITSSGYTLNETTVTANNGEDWAITSSINLDSGSSWITQPSPNSFSDNGTFMGQNVNTPITYTGQLEDSSLVEPGCNTPGALNYLEGSDGTETCYTSIGTFYTGADDSSACESGSSSSGTTVILASSDDDDNIREVTSAGTRIGGAQGVYSDGETWTRYLAGSVTETGNCPTSTANISLDGDWTAINGEVNKYDRTGTAIPGFPGSFLTNASIRINLGDPSGWPVGWFQLHITYNAVVVGQGDSIDTSQTGLNDTISNFFITNPVQNEIQWDTGIRETLTGYDTLWQITIVSGRFTDVLGEDLADVVFTTGERSRTISARQTS